MPAGDAFAEIAIHASHVTLGGISAIGVVEAGASHGKRVLVGPFDPCGECDVCRRGGAAVCPQRTPRVAIADRVTAAGRYIVPIDDGLTIASPSGAAVAGDATLAYTLYARTGPAPRDPVVIAGASPVTRFLVEILIAKGISPIAVADPDSSWGAWLRDKSVAVARDREGVASAITALATSRAPRVIATTSESIPLAAALAGPRSTLTVLAPVDALPGGIAEREVTVITVAGPHPDLIVEVAAMCSRGEIDLAGGTSSAATADHRAIVQQR